jgi:predicted aspartyl protease
MIDRRTLIATPPALLLASAAAGAPPGNLRWDSHYLLLRVSVNGKPVDALLDFSVKQTLLDRRHAANLGVDPAGNGTTIEAAGRTLGPLKAAVIDLTDYANQLLRGRIGLVLGRDLFAHGPWRLDLATPLLTPADPQRAHRGHLVLVSDRFGFATIPIFINGIAAQAALSFQDLDQIRVSAPFAARIGLGRARGTAAARRKGATQAGVAVDRLDIAGTRITGLEAALEAGEHTPDVWLGPAILRRFRIGIDLSAGALWFDPA